MPGDVFVDHRLEERMVGALYDLCRIGPGRLVVRHDYVGCSGDGVVVEDVCAFLEHPRGAIRLLEHHLPVLPAASRWHGRIDQQDHERPTVVSPFPAHGRLVFLVHLLHHFDYVFPTRGRG